MFLFHNQENKPLKAGRGTEKPMQSYRILRDQAMKGKEVTKRKLLQEPLKEEVKVAWTREQQRQEEKLKYRQWLEAIVFIDMVRM